MKWKFKGMLAMGDAKGPIYLSETTLSNGEKIQRRRDLGYVWRNTAYRRLRDAVAAANA